MDMIVFASVAKSLAEIKMLIGKHSLEHTVGVFIIPRTRHGIGKFLIIISSLNNTFLWSMKLAICRMRKLERCKNIEQTILRKRSIIEILTSHKH